MNRKSASALPLSLLFQMWLQMGIGPEMTADKRPFELKYIG